jgi:hypothetical protein
VGLGRVYFACLLVSFIVGERAPTGLIAMVKSWGWGGFILPVSWFHLLLVKEPLQG